MASAELAGGSTLVVMAGLTAFCCLDGSGAEGEVSLTGGPHLDPVVLMRLADDIIGPDAEAVVPRVPEDVGQVVSCVDHGHGVTFPFLQRKALMFETPAHGQRGAARKQGRFCSEMAQQSVCTQTKPKKGQVAMNFSVLSRTEHPAVLASASHLPYQGTEWYLRGGPRP